MEKSKLILKNFFGIIFVDIFFLGTELIAAYIEGKPIKIISSINISCFVILLILTIIRLIRKDYEISMYSALLLFGCSLSWVKKHRNNYRNSLCYKYRNWNINSSHTGKG